MEQYGGLRDVGRMSPELGKSTKLQLPMSCDPPGPGNPAKQLVWVVSRRFIFVMPLFSCETIRIKLPCVRNRGNLQLHGVLSRTNAITRFCTSTIYTH
jgi:hypothetical protein